MTSIDFFTYLIGKWKRNLEWREFGGIYQHLSTSNTFLQFEENTKYESTYISESSAASSNTQTPNNRYVRFSFGNSPQDMKFAYEMIFQPLSSSSSSTTTNLQPNHRLSQSQQAQQEIQHFQWKYLGNICKGEFYPLNQVAILKVIMPTSFITTTYRILDESTMAVVIVEVDEKQQPTIQYGNMYRLN
ncbi:hypothetical protein C9374_005374 [Naegleria lovaniensis]|uniref:Uncharacterized protein n=1 Tax=Naegleria lovaniensis TaxID=51637 RepID=A0AA88KIG2_NAELO|nr:uncharacterized protein C9374_005374 [Naegleria lovaniensis]KAG2382172.1 hypothetical protein C9374_005374 [Naegleria lovaniensis]